MRAVCVALVLLLGGCGEDEDEAGELRGSVSRIYGLSHDGVRARLSNSELAIQYTAGREVPVQVVVDLGAMPLDGPATVDLATAGDVLGRRGDARLPDLRGCLHIRGRAGCRSARRGQGAKPQQYSEYCKRFATLASACRTVPSDAEDFVGKLLKTGTLTLDAYAPEAGARAAGSFEAVVTAKGDDYTLVGSFDAPLEDLR